MNDNDLLKAAHRYLLHNEAVSGADELVQQLVDALDEAIKRGDQYHEENDQLFKRAVEAEENGRHAQRAPTPDLTKALTEFSDFINEPPQYEDKRMVRDYRHELARKWVPLLEQLLALTSTVRGDT